jgi:AcrR family transcriptional regulator
MARRSDHTREELRELFVREGHALMEETGFARFSGREAAKRAGYTVGTIYNIFGSLDGMLLAINTRTFEQWTAFLKERLAAAGSDRIAALVEAYFDFAAAHPNLWMAIYDHRLPEGMAIPPGDAALRGALTQIVEDEVRLHVDAEALDIARFARSLIAIAHGHCSYMLTGSFAVLGETDPVGSALDRVRECLAAHAIGRKPGGK